MGVRGYRVRVKGFGADQRGFRVSQLRDEICRPEDAVVVQTAWLKILLV